MKQDTDMKNPIGVLIRAWGYNPRTVLWTLELGRYRTGNEYFDALEAAELATYRHKPDEDNLRSSLVNNPQFSCAQEGTRVDLAVLSVGEDFGYKKGACWGELNRKRKNFGLKMCPAEVGPALRLAYQVQPCGEENELQIAMEPYPQEYDFEKFTYRLYRADDGEMGIRPEKGHFVNSLEYPWNNNFKIRPETLLVFVR